MVHPVVDGWCVLLRNSSAPGINAIIDCPLTSIQDISCVLISSLIE